VRCSRSCLLLAATLAFARPPRVARADAPPPWAPLTVGISVIGFGGGVGPGGHGGVGPDVEVAVGRGRWQVFGEAASLWGSHGAVDGPGGRLALGARYLARSIDVDGAAIELVFDGGVGLERYAWRQGGGETRPDVAIGFGAQVRWLDGPHLIFRWGGRLLFGPADAAPAVACRGGCALASPVMSNGFMAVLGVAW
jgi:hypothetical protein